MTPQELKNSILQLAIQGKLVEQRLEEGTAEDLYKQIQTEKQRLIKAGIIKKEKPLPDITEDEKPFDIPESWKWARIGDIYKLQMGQSPDGESVSESTFGIEFHQGKVFFSEDYLQKSNQVTNKPTKIATPYSVLLCVRAPVGIVNINEREICIGRGLCAVSTYADMDVKYVLYSLRCCKTDFIKKATGTTFVAITGEVVKNHLVPLPPLAEQKRIVAKIEELLPYIDRYEQAWSKLENFNKRFPADMQKSILQTAIQGKLVEQRPEDGTGEELYRQIQAEKQRLIKAGTIKKEKPLSEITEDEKPFDIPESWKWVRVTDIAFLSSGNQYDECTDGTLYIKVADMNLPENQYEICTSTRRANVKATDTIPVGSIIFPKRGGAIATNKKRLVLREPICVDSNTMAMTIVTGTILPYLSKWFSSIDIGKLATGTSVPQINNKDIYPLLIPLPPLAEQKRIVAKLEEILPMCEKLK